MSRPIIISDTPPCPTCGPWRATSERQLANRLADLADGGMPYACPQCSGTGWATTRSAIRRGPPELPHGYFKPYFEIYPEGWIIIAFAAALIIGVPLLIWVNQ